MRIGEILRRRQNRVDFLRRSRKISETYSDDKLETPKTRSSQRVIPMSSALSKALEAHQVRCIYKQSGDLVYIIPTRTGVQSIEWREFGSQMFSTLVLASRARKHQVVRIQRVSL